MYCMYLNGIVSIGPSGHIMRLADTPIMYSGKTWTQVQELTDNEIIKDWFEQKFVSEF